MKIELKTAYRYQWTIDGKEGGAVVAWDSPDAKGDGFTVETTYNDIKFYNAEAATLINAIASVVGLTVLIAEQEGEA